MVRLAIIVLFTFIRLFGCSRQPKMSNHPAEKKTALVRTDSVIPFRFYANTVTLKIKGDPLTSPVVFISLHDDEATGQQVVQSYLLKNKVAFIRIENNRHRLINFRYLHKSYAFDPNRIFTRKGIRKTLDLYGTYSDSAIALINRFASLILQQLSPAKIIVAVHNNSNKNYSIVSYLKGGVFFKNAKKVNKDTASDPDDFLLTTSESLFEKLRAKGMSVVLQDNINVADNGSLSVYYRNSKNCYVNIEAQEGHFVQQSEMLQSLASVLKTAQYSLVNH